jgi:hypothetical protein
VRSIRDEISAIQAHGADVIERNDGSCERFSPPVQTGYHTQEQVSLTWVRPNTRTEASIVVIPALLFAEHLTGSDSYRLQSKNEPRRKR